MASRVHPFVSRRTCRVWSSARSHEFGYTSSRNVNSSWKTLQNSSVAAAMAPQVRADSVNGAINALAAVHDFEDAEGLFSGLTRRKLITSLFNLLVVSCEPVADLGMKPLKSPLMDYAPYRVPLLKAAKRTAFSHFCAGESVAEASDTLNRMWALDLKGILDYSLEDAVDNAACDANLRQFLTTVQSTPSLPPGSSISEYNKGLESLVYGTIQAYLKDALPRLIEASEAAKKQGISMALKLVRGAYITRESA